MGGGRFEVRKQGAGESSEKHLLIKIRRVGAAVVFFFLAQSLYME